MTPQVISAIPPFLRNPFADYFFARDADRAWRDAESVDAGMVGTNDALISKEMALFGRINELGLGREGSCQGIEEFLETECVPVTDANAEDPEDRHRFATIRTEETKL